MKKLGKKIKKGLHYSDRRKVLVGDIVLHNMDICVIYDGSDKNDIRIRSLTNNIEQTAAIQDLRFILSASYYPDHEAKTLDEWVTRFSRTLGHYTEVLDNKSLVERFIASDAVLRRKRDNIFRIPDPYTRSELLQRNYVSAAVEIIYNIPMKTLLTEKLSTRTLSQSALSI